MYLARALNASHFIATTDLNTAIKAAAKLRATRLAVEARAN